MNHESLSDIIVVSDQHCGDNFGLYPLDARLKLSEGSSHSPGHSQRRLWGLWGEFREWARGRVGGRPFALVHNGDGMDGVHHNTVTQFTHNLADQRAVFNAVMQPFVKEAERYFHNRGTEAHGGQSGQDEEQCARDLGAEPDERTGHHARWNLWLDCGGILCHFKHHIGTTGSMAYASTALQKEITESLAEAARLGKPIPRIMVRSHRHRPGMVAVPGPTGDVYCVVTPGWQIVSPIAWRMPGSRQTLGEFGGVHIRVENGEPTIKTWTRMVDRDETVVL